MARAAAQSTTSQTTTTTPVIVDPREYGLNEDETPKARPAPPPAPRLPKDETPKPKDDKPQKRETPSNSVDAEMGVLGSILLGERPVMFRVEQQIADVHFFSPANQQIFRTLKEMHEDNDPMDFISVTDQLQKRNILDAVGGHAYIGELFAFVPSPANVGYYMDVLKEKHAYREVTTLLRRQLEAVTQGADLQDTIARTEDSLKAIKTSKRIGELPEIDDMSLLMGENMPKPPAELVQGILHRGSKLIIGGTSKGRKTFSLMDLAISVATGTQWWGLNTIKGKVCYINFEIQRPFFARRYEDICRKKGTKPDPGMFKCWTLRGYSEGLEKMSANIIKQLLQEDYSLIIFDPIYKALGDRDENKAGDVASMLNELEAIAVKTNAAIAFGAHYSKGNQAAKDAMDRIGGSGVFARDPDAILTMTPHATEECFTVDCTLRNFPPQKPFVVKWEWPLFDRDETEDPEALKQPKKVNHRNDGKFDEQFTEASFLDLLHKHNNGRTPTEFKRLSMEQLLCSESTFKRYWRKIKDCPYIQEKNGRFFTSPLYSPTQKP